MEFYRPAQKTRQVPIVPLIDILVILLFFFIVTTVPKHPRHVLSIDLPTSKNAPSDVIVADRSVLAVDESGTIMLDGVQVPEGALTDFLLAFQRVNPGRELELEADEEVSFRLLFLVWDALTAAGIEPKNVPARIQKQSSAEAPKQTPNNPEP